MLTITTPHSTLILRSSFSQLRSSGETNTSEIWLLMRGSDASTQAIRYQRSNNAKVIEPYLKQTTLHLSSDLIIFHVWIWSSMRGQQCRYIVTLRWYHNLQGLRPYLHNSRLMSPHLKQYYRAGRRGVNIWNQAEEAFDYWTLFSSIWWLSYVWVMLQVVECENGA